MSRSNKFVLYVFAGLLAIGIVGILLYKGKIFNEKHDIEAEHKLPAIKIVLINGCGFEGLAKEFGDFLAEKNVDIVSMSNTRKPTFDKTIIVVRKGDDEDLKRLQRMTGIQRYTEARNETALADFDIIVGKDYLLYTKK